MAWEEEPICAMRIRNTAKKYDIDLVEFFRGEPYSGHYQMKIDRLSEKIKEYAGTHQIVLYTDGEDSVFTNTIEEIHRRYLALNHPFVMSSNTVCWPNSDMGVKFPETKTRFRYLCAGGFMADIGHYLKTIEILDEKRKRLGWSPNNRYPCRSIFRDDQAALNEAYANREIDLKIDSECQIFVVGKNVRFWRNRNQHLYFDTDGITLLETGTKPCIIHGKVEQIYQYIMSL